MGRMNYARMAFLSGLIALAAVLAAPALASAALPDDPNYAPYQPALDNDERGMLGLINDARAASGLSPLVASAILNTAADSYVSFLVTTGQNSHDAFGTPADRLADAGWPMAEGARYGGEVRNYGYSTQETFEFWMASATHRSILLTADASINSIGLGKRDDKWIIDLGACPAAALAKCGLTGDVGDSNLLATGDPGTPATSLGITVERKGKQVRLTLDGVSDGLLLELSRGAKHVKRGLSGTGQVKTTVKLASGKWKLEALSGSASVCAKFKLAPVKPAKGQGSWVKVKTTRC